MWGAAPLTSASHPERGWIMIHAVDTQAENPHENLINGYRALANILSEHPELPSPINGGNDSFWFWFHGENPAVEMRQARRMFGGVFEKKVTDWYAALRGKLYGLDIVLASNRDDVCTKVMIREETVTEEVPDPEYVAKAPTVTVTKKREVSEWVCPKIWDAE